LYFIDVYYILFKIDFSKLLRGEYMQAEIWEKDRQIFIELHPRTKREGAVVGRLTGLCLEQQQVFLCSAAIPIGFGHARVVKF
jgi:hypothetical protein